MNIKKTIFTCACIFISIFNSYLYFEQPIALSEEEPNPQQMASNQVVQVNFEAEIMELKLLENVERLPIKQYKVALMDKNPKWSLILKVLPHEYKIPFPPGINECLIGDPKIVFGVPAEQVSGKYNFSYNWYINTSGTSAVSDFKAVKIR